jgi:hypothetical protein
MWVPAGTMLSPCSRTPWPIRAPAPIREWLPIPAAHGRSSAQVHVITDDDMVPDHGLTVDPAPKAHPAAGADAGAGLDISCCTDIGVLFRQDPGPDQPPAIGVPVVGGDPAGVVLDDLGVIPKDGPSGLRLSRRSASPNRSA